MPDRLEAMFDASHPFGAFVRRESLPCCTLTGLALASLSGVRLDLSSRQRAVDSARREMGGAWWMASQIDRMPRWSTLDAWPAGVTAADVAYQPPRLVSSSMPAPVLTLGRWTLIQRWRGGQGHTYLVRADDAVGRCTVYQSSEARGFRVSAGSWDGTAGLAGWDVGAVTLPALGAA